MRLKKAQNQNHPVLTFLKQMVCIQIKRFISFFLCTCIFINILYKQHLYDKRNLQLSVVFFYMLRRVDDILAKYLILILYSYCTNNS